MKQLIVAVLVMFGAGIGWAADKPATAPAAPASPAVVKGKVLETKDVDNYTYLHLKTKDGDVWAAVSRVAVKAGADVTIENPMELRDFESKTLNRKFDRIYFGKVEGAKPAAGGMGAGSGMATGGTGGDLASMHAGIGKPVAPGVIRLDKATGPDSRTVAEIVGGRVALKDRNVVLRAKVVKVTPEVMGKNWVHVRDGTGSGADGSDDVLVTTKDNVSIGDVVLVKGVVHVDKDLGSGYSYKVLVEDATLQKQ
jgi:hypothetical protein